MTTDTDIAPSRTSPPAGSARRLTTEECRSWLTAHGEGRLGYESGRGPRQVVVSYAVSDDANVLRVPAFNEIAQYAPGRRVTLDVSGPEGPDEIEHVKVTGRASVVAEAPAAVLDKLPDEHWPADLSDVTVRLQTEEIDGHTTGITHRHS